MTKTVANSKKLMIGAVSILALAVAGVLVYLNVPTNYLTLDINPSIELKTNRLNNVVAINPINEDAKELLKGYKPQDGDLDSVIEDIVEHMVSAGYINSGKDNNILITAKENNQDTKLLVKVNSAIEQYLANHHLKASVLTQQLKIDQQKMNQARTSQLSTGKLALIEKLLKEDDSLTAHDLASANLTELIELAKANNLSVKDLVDEYYDAIEDIQDDDKDDIDDNDDDKDDIDDNDDDKDDIDDNDDDKDDIDDNDDDKDDIDDNNDDDKDDIDDNDDDKDDIDDNDDEKDDDEKEKVEELAEIAVEICRYRNI